MTLTTSICSMIGPVCCGGSLMSTAQFESSLLVTADVAWTSSAAVEQLMLAAVNRNPNVRAIQSSSHRSRSNVRVDVDVDEQEALIRDMRRNPEKYQDQ